MRGDASGHLGAHRRNRQTIEPFREQEDALSTRAFASVKPRSHAKRASSPLLRFRLSPVGTGDAVIAHACRVVVRVASD